MNCMNWTKSDNDNCVIINSPLLYSILSIAGALLLIVIVQCIALIVCGSFHFKGRRHRTQEKAIEASNGHELKARLDNKDIDDQQSATKQSTPPTAERQTDEDDNDDMYDMVREDLVNKTTQLKKVPPVPSYPSSDYANVNLPTSSANNTLERPKKKKPEAAGNSVLPPADVYNPETGGATTEIAQYAKIDMAKKTKKKDKVDEPPPPLPPVLSNYDEIVHHDSSAAADSDTTADYNKLNHNTRRRTVDFSTLGDDQDSTYDTIVEQKSTTKLKTLPVKPISAVSRSQECLANSLPRSHPSAASHSQPRPSTNQPALPYTPADNSTPANEEPEYDVVHM